MNHQLAVIKDEDYQVLQVTPTLLKEVIQTNLGNEIVSAFDFDKITIPTGGVTSWQLKTLTGEKSVKELEGIMVFWKNSRAFFKEAFGEGEGKPECVSEDGVKGIGDPGGECASCPYNQFGSDLKGGKGKACREVKALFMLLKDNILPVVVVLSPTSLPAAKAYLLRLTSKLIPYYAVTTKLTLEKTTNNNRIAYSVAILSLGERLSEEQAAKVKAYQQLIKPYLERVTVSDVPEKEEEEIAPF